MLVRITCFAINGEVDVLVCGQSDGAVLLLNVHSLAPLQSLDISSHGAIRCITFSEGTV